MTSTLNSVALRTHHDTRSQDIQFKAKYPLGQSDPGNPLVGLFNYVPLQSVLKASAQNPSPTPEFMKKLIEEFHDQQLLSMKVKYLPHSDVDKGPRSAKPSLTLSQPMKKVPINHSHFRQDQIAQGNGDSYENLICKMRLRSDKLNASTEVELTQLLSGLLREQTGPINTAIRNALASGQPLEIALRDAEAKCLDQITERLGDQFDLTIELERPELLEDIVVVIGRSTYHGANRELSRPGRLRALNPDGTMHHYVTLPTRDTPTA